MLKLFARPTAVCALIALFTCIAQADLFVGTGDFIAGTADNAIFDIDVNTNTSASIGNLDIWGATWIGGSTVMFSSVDGSSGSREGDNLWTYNRDTGVFGQVGVITNVNANPNFRADGLAFSRGNLYAFQGFARGSAPAGLYVMNPNTFQATLAVPSVIGTNDISGIDADPRSGIIYGVDDGTRRIVRFDLTAGTIIPVASYAGFATDIDGLAAGPGTLYLVEDQNAPLRVFDLATLTYIGSLTSPFSVADTFSGAAFIVPEPTAEAILALCGFAFCIRRRVG